MTALTAYENDPDRTRRVAIKGLSQCKEYFERVARAKVTNMQDYQKMREKQRLFRRVLERVGNQSA